MLVIMQVLEPTTSAARGCHHKRLEHMACPVLQLHGQWPYVVIGNTRSTRAASDDMVDGATDTLTMIDACIVV